MYYKVKISSSQSNFNITHYCEARSSNALMLVLREYPGLDLKNLGYEVTSINPIGREEFEKGREEEKNSPQHLRTHVRFNVSEKCLLEPLSENSRLSQLLYAETRDYSAGGLKLFSEGANLHEGMRLKVYVENLNISDKEASVVWSKALPEGVNMSGLRWA